MVGANINHTELVELAEKHFVNQTTSWATVPSSTIDNNVSVYTGGMAKVESIIVIQFNIMIVSDWPIGITNECTSSRS